MTVVPIRSRRLHRMQFVQKLQHAVPSVVVLGDGIDHLTHDPQGFNLALGIVEVGVAALVIGSVIRGFRQLRKQVAPAHADHAHAHGVDWIDVCLAAMLIVEVFAKHHATGHWQRPMILLAVVLFAVGLLHGRLAAWGDRKRELRIGADGISVPGRLFSRLTLPWSEVASIDTDDRSALVTAFDGRSKRIDLSDIFQPTAVRDALMTARTFLDESRHASDASIESIPFDN